MGAESAIVEGKNVDQQFKKMKECVNVRITPIYQDTGSKIRKKT